MDSLLERLILKGTVHWHFPRYQHTISFLKEERHQVERNYHCTACGKDFKVMNDEAASHEVEEGDLDVHCVYCQVSKQIKWPRGHRYIVAIKKSHAPTLPMPVTM